MSRALIIVQARLGSTRLPGKVLFDLAGQPLILRMVERLRRIQTPAHIIVATPTDIEDDALADFCTSSGMDVYRGHPTDLLDRHYQAAIAYHADPVAKIPSDCPLIDPAVVDRVFARFAQGDCDYASNLHPASYPDGNDVEVMSLAALAKAWREARRDFEREHTTPYLWENPQCFRIANVLWEGKTADTPAPDYSMSHRWTIDYPEDYAFIQRVYAELYADHPSFGLDDILALLARKPDIAALNEKYAGVNWYRHHLHQLKTVGANQTRLLGSS